MGLSPCWIFKHCSCLNLLINGHCPGMLTWTESVIIFYRNILENSLRLKTRRARQIKESGLGSYAVFLSFPPKFTGKKAKQKNKQKLQASMTSAFEFQIVLFSRFCIRTCKFHCFQNSVASIIVFTIYFYRYKRKNTLSSYLFIA